MIIVGKNALKRDVNDENYTRDYKQHGNKKVGIPSSVKYFRSKKCFFHILFCLLQMYISPFFNIAAGYKYNYNQII